MGKHGHNQKKDEGRQLAQSTGAMPKKKFYRQRAHCNPLNDSTIDAPLTPAALNWAEHFPAYIAPDGSALHADVDPVVRFADIGCGFGGMTIALAEMFPKTLVVAMEIRAQVTSYVQQRIIALRKDGEEKGEAGGGGALALQNAAAIRANTMKCMANYFTKGQLQKMFFLFPDPHFKTSNHRRRIINTFLLSEYAFFLQPGGILYTITDVQELGTWMREKLEGHPLFEALTEEELAADPVAALLTTVTEEGKKVARNGGTTWRACFRRVQTLHEE